MFRRGLLITALALLAAAAPASAAPIGTPTVIATNLSTPWSVVKLPDGGVLVTEIVGRIRVIENGALNPTPVYEDLPARKFLGLALSPNYASNRFVYLYETRDAGSRVVRLRDTGDELVEPTVIFSGIDTDFIHDGGRIAFGPDGFLYVTTGDIHDPDLPPDPNSLNGKILRMTEAGDPAPTNPFNTDATRGNRDYVYSSGHRHPQGLAWDADGRLWQTEHGPSGEPYAPAGASSGRDELNLILPGRNYGWPSSAGEVVAPGTEPPKWESGEPPAFAPGGLAFSVDDGLLYAPGLKGEALRTFSADLAGVVTPGSVFFQTTFGRLRAATTTPGALWLTTHTVPMRVLCVPVGNTLPGPDPARVCSTQRVDGGARVLTSQPGPQTPPATTTPPSDPPVTTSPPPVAERSAAASVEALLARLRRARISSLRRLVRRGFISARGGGFEAGSRLTFRVQLRRSGRPALTVASAVVRPRSRSEVTVRATFTRRGRAALRRVRTARLILRVAYTPPGGAPVVRTAATLHR